MAWPAVQSAQDARDNSAGARLNRDVAALTRTLGAFLQADVALADDIAGFADPRSAWLHHPRHQTDLARAIQRTATHLQAYVGAAHALVDHARRFRRTYAPADSGRGSEYDKRIAELFDTPAATIVGLLRNYSMHYALPVLIAQPDDVVSAEGWSTTLAVDTQSLLALTISAKDRALLVEHSPGVPMAAVVEMYSSRVVSFYSWLVARLNVWFTSELAELHQLSRDLEVAMAEAGLGEVPKLIRHLERRRRGR